jgi:hypothetical protein
LQRLAVVARPLRDGSACGSEPRGGQEDEEDPMAERFETMDQAAFGALPTAPAGAGTDEDDAGEAEEGEGSAWDGVMARLEAGEAIQIPTADERAARRARNRLEKRAERRGIVLEVRQGEGFMAARKTGEVAGGRKERRGGDGQRRRDRDGEPGR